MSAPSKFKGASTTLLHSGRDAIPAKSVAPPIFQSSTYHWDNLEEGFALANSKAPTQFYARWGHPNGRQLEEILAALEGTEGALATASGASAMALAVLPWVRPGDHVVVARTVYGETRNLITQIAAGFGVHCSIAKSSDVAAFEDAISDSTRVVIVETPANPTLECVDIHAVAAIAHAKGARLVVDNTFATPINTQPAKLGADAVVHSATKYLAGHSDVLAGVLATDADGVARARDWLRITGPALGPFEAWLVVRGLRTLELRMARHNANGLAVAKLLESHKAVARVNYPGLTSHHSHAIAQKQMRAFGAMASVELVGGREMAKRFVENLSLFSPATSLGGVESLVQYPASLAKMSEDDQRASGISEHLIRLSVGCENPEDLLEDLSRSLERL